MANNDHNDKMIKHLDHEKYRQRHKITQEYAAILRHNASKLKGKLKCLFYVDEENLLAKKKGALSELERDLADLELFKSASLNDPEANIKQQEAQKQLFASLIEIQKKEEEDFLSKFEEERELADRLVINKVMEIVDSAKNGLSGILRNKTFVAHQENHRLKKEIQYQLSAHSELEAEINNIENSLLEKRSKPKLENDPRRFSIKDRMNCKPDMDIFLS